MSMSVATRPSVTTAASAAPQLLAQAVQRSPQFAQVKKDVMALAAKVTSPQQQGPIMQIATTVVKSVAEGKITRTEGVELLDEALMDVRSAAPLAKNTMMSALRTVVNGREAPGAGRSQDYKNEAQWFLQEYFAERPRG